jgi:hypothetical protein
MHKNATKCNETLSKWCKNKHGASKIIDTFETYHNASRTLSIIVQHRQLVSVSRATTIGNMHVAAMVSYLVLFEGIEGEVGFWGDRFRRWINFGAKLGRQKNLGSKRLGQLSGKLSC